MKKASKKKEFAKESEITQVPLHRAYGVTKKEGFFAHANEVIATLIAVGLYILCFAYIIIGLTVFTLLLGELGVVIWAVILLLFVNFVLLRKVRKRAAFFRRLKKCAKAYGLKIEKKRSFWQGLRLNKQGFDFSVESEKKIWFVRFFTTPRKRLNLIFEDPKTVKLVKIKSKKRFFINRNNRQGKINILTGVEAKNTKVLEYSLDEKPEYAGGKKCAKALVLNPTPFELFYCDGDGARIPTGTGHQFSDYTLFSGSGFLNTLSREGTEI